jgi:nicotinate-nucleotide pyrophosphorylase (carboxylating)
MQSASHDPIAIALAEDIGSGDLTAQFFVEQRLGSARLLAKEPAVAAGVETAAEVFRRVAPTTRVRVLHASGSRLAPGDSVLEIEGPLPSLLTAERVALNFLQHLSGIATLTRRFVDAVAGTRARILDTRKTIPGLRALEKAAVRAGGGSNHRMGLHDMVMIKDNHLAAGTSPSQDCTGHKCRNLHQRHDQDHVTFSFHSLTFQEGQPHRKGHRTHRSVVGRYSPRISLTELTYLFQYGVST